MAKIAWIGLGHMGGPMTANLVKAGHEVRGFDLSREATDAAAANGVTITTDIAQAVQGAEAVFTMLPRGEHVLAVYTQPGGVLESADRSALLVDSSTIDIASARRLHELARERGFRFVDAPVSGGISGAAAGTLAFMVGGVAEHVEAACAFIEPMASNIIRTGGPTSGQAAKICNNMMLFINLAGCAEGATLAHRLGLDPKIFWDVASVSSGDSWALRTWYPVAGIIDTSAANRNFEATFTAELAHKDIGLALAAGAETGTELPFAALAQAQVDELRTRGFGAKDCSLIVKLVDGSLPETGPDLPEPDPAGPAREL